MAMRPHQADTRTAPRAASQRSVLSFPDVSFFTVLVFPP
jgi:hypothetical protein